MEETKTTLRIAPVKGDNGTMGLALYDGEDVVAIPAGQTVAEQAASARRIERALAGGAR